MYYKYPDNYTFPACVSKDNAHYCVRFQDLPGCVAIGDSLDDALKLGKESLSLHLWGMEQDGEDIPAPTSMQDVHLEDGETLCLLDVNMFKIRAKMDNHSIKKTLTIPWYLNTLAEERKINFSQLLQGALRQRLGLD